MESAIIGAMENKKRIRMLTTGMHVFPRLIADKEKKYVDKTDLLYELARDKTDAQLFISRPRRFGKSLMLSTLKAMFECRRELFEGLAIDSLPWEWDKPYPVLDFTMASATGTTYEDFRGNLRGLVKSLAANHEVPFSDGETTEKNFEDLIQAVANKSDRKQVVVLIDEYDEPVAGFLDDLPTLAKVRADLHEFYEKLKINAGFIRFLLMTGVTKFTKLSIFSGMNHLKDRTMDPRFATLLGFTPAELDGPLRENVEAFGEMNGIDFAAAKAKLLEWYDGYRFSPDSEEKVCNPVSLGCALESGKLQNYWESTGASRMILNRLARIDKIIIDYEALAVRPIVLDVCDAETLPIESLLYQGGYLSIKGVRKSGMLELGVPNKEIRSSLRDGYISRVLASSSEDWFARLDDIKTEVEESGIETFLKRNLRALFAKIPHEWKIENEPEAKRYFLLSLSLVGADVSGERQSARGRADAILKDKSGVYVFEFKYGKTTEEAIEQARTKDYAGPWLDGNPPVFLVGVNYDPEKRGIDDPCVVPVTA